MESSRVNDSMFLLAMPSRLDSLARRVHFFREPWMITISHSNNSAFVLDHIAWPHQTQAAHRWWLMVLHSQCMHIRERTKRRQKVYIRKRTRPSSRANRFNWHFEVDSNCQRSVIFLLESFLAKRNIQFYRFHCALRKMIVHFAASHRRETGYCGVRRRIFADDDDDDDLLQPENIRAWTRGKIKIKRVKLIKMMDDDDMLHL